MAVWRRLKKQRRRLTGSSTWLSRGETGASPSGRQRRRIRRARSPRLPARQAAAMTSCLHGWTTRRTAIATGERLLRIADTRRGRCQAVEAPRTEHYKRRRRIRIAALAFSLQWRCELCTHYRVWRGASIAAAPTSSRPYALGAIRRRRMTASVVAGGSSSCCGRAPSRVVSQSRMTGTVRPRGG